MLTAFVNLAYSCAPTPQKSVQQVAEGSSLLKQIWVLLCIFPRLVGLDVLQPVSCLYVHSNIATHGPRSNSTIQACFISK